jgi:4-hydroxybenzoate polyprenyltransferase
MADDATSTLYVDLDGTLIHTDLLYEAVLLACRRRLSVLFWLPLWLLRGKAALKQELAQRVTPRAELLPYRRDVLEFLGRQRRAGRRVVLVTASPRRWAAAVADHVDLFDDVMATEEGRNLKGAEKLAAIREHAEGATTFDYVGDAPADLSVWAQSGHVYAVAPGGSLEQRVRKLGKPVTTFGERPSRIAALIKVVRPHQWTKNLLLFLAAFLAHRLSLTTLGGAFLGFVSFSAAASATYVVNDLLDIEADRSHPKKCKRPFASGALPCQWGPVLVAVLLIVAAVAAAPLPPLFWLGVAGYLAATTLYSIYLKRKTLVDVFTLAGLYTLRIIAGGWAVSVPVSNWLLGLSVFLFTSLAFAKRATELSEAPEAAVQSVRGRGYGREDLPVVEQMGIAAAYASVLVMALYISGDKVQQMYSHPNVLWLACPVLLYWLSRMWIKVRRGLLHHDPVVFAITDLVSLVCGALIVAIAIAAT